MPLNARQRAFVSAYLVDKKAGKAYLQVYKCKPETAETNGPELLRNAQIAAAVEEGLQAQFARNECSADRILEEMRRVALSDIGSYFDERGNLRPLHTMTKAERACIASIEVIQRNLTSGDGEVDTLHKLKAWDKIRALEMLGKHFNLFEEKVQVTGDLTIRVEVPWQSKP